MHQIDLRQFDLNLLVTFDVLMDERNVTRASARLGRTQSAVSHALSRLREQVGDPLLIKQGGRMTASPFAERMIEDVRPILRNIQRALVPSSPFDPATTTRTFRVGILDGVPGIFPRLLAKVHREAPRAAVDWVPEGLQTLLAVADGQIDVAFVAAALNLPEGVGFERSIPELTWASFVRRDHPAIAGWGRSAWARWPHVVVRVDNALPSPVTSGPARAGKRVVGARVPSFSNVGPLLARTDMIATLPIVTLHDAVKIHDLQVLRPPFPIARFAHQLVWSARLGNDPAILWMRRLLMDSFTEIVKDCEPYVAKLRTSRSAIRQTSSP
jgi:DNA-binding transcriptional LysR family regulator